MVKRYSLFLRILRVLFSLMLVLSLVVVVLAFNDPKAVDAVLFVYAICVLIFLLCLAYVWFLKQELIIAHIENIDDMSDDLKAIRKLLEKQSEVEPEEKPTN